jgi:hypothetical protein
MEPAIRAEIALLLSKLEERRGAVVDVIHWFRVFSLDVACEESSRSHLPRLSSPFQSTSRFWSRRSSFRHSSNISKS